MQSIVNAEARHTVAPRQGLEYERVNVLDVGVNTLNIPRTLDILSEWIANREPNYVCFTGVHGVMESRRDENLRRIHNTAGLVAPDGMPLVWLSRLQGRRQAERVYGPDLMLALCEHSAASGYRHFLYGASEDTLEKLASNLQQRCPRLRIVGKYSPPFRPLTDEEDEEVVRTINEAKPDIVWVGLSTPKQEHWMASHVHRLTAPVLLGVGAAFDFHAGVKKQAPRWMQRSGLEWLFRLATEPRRLGPRYLVNNPLFVLLVLRQMLSQKHSPDTGAT
jgi:N-acetylglucosaminyldiphosphoundecaprenol N-acetyl-beta-D-mannosaminyltransferase